MDILLFVLLIFIFLFFSIPGIILLSIRKIIHSSKSFNWILEKNAVIVFHILTVATMLAITFIYGDNIDIVVILITAPFVFLFHYRFSNFTIGLFCFFIYLSLMYSIDRVSDYPLYENAFILHPSNASLRNYIFLLLRFINFSLVFCFLFNLISVRNKQVIIFSFCSILIFYSQLLYLPTLIARQIQGASLIDIKSMKSKYSNFSDKKVLFTKITSTELYALVIHENQPLYVLCFKKNLFDSHFTYQDQIDKVFFLIPSQEITIPKWQVILLSKGI